MTTHEPQQSALADLARALTIENHRCDAAIGRDDQSVCALKRCKRMATFIDPHNGHYLCTFHKDRFKGVDTWVGNTDERVSEQERRLKAEARWAQRNAS